MWRRKATREKWVWLLRGTRLRPTKNKGPHADQEMLPEALEAINMTLDFIEEAAKMLVDIKSFIRITKLISPVFLFWLIIEDF
jgi:hypothetical protein